MILQQHHYKTTSLPNWGNQKNSLPTSVTYYPEKPFKTFVATAVTPNNCENHLYSPSISFQPSTHHNTMPILASSTNTLHYTPRDNLNLLKVATLTQWLTQPQQKIHEQAQKTNHKKVSHAVLLPKGMIFPPFVQLHGEALLPFSRPHGT
jgi:hypothetical protein